VSSCTGGAVVWLDVALISQTHGLKALDLVKQHSLLRSSFPAVITHCSFASSLNFDDDSSDGIILLNVKRAHFINIFT